MEAFMARAIQFIKEKTAWLLQAIAFGKRSR